MGMAIKDMVPFLVLAFILGQFIALFDWSGIGSGIAVAGADGLKSMGLTGFVVIVLFIMLCSVLNLFIVSGSSMWTLMAAVFVPLFGLLGYEPASSRGIPGRGLRDADHHAPEPLPVRLPIFSGATSPRPGSAP